MPPIAEITKAQIISHARHMCIIGHNQQNESLWNEGKYLQTFCFDMS